MSKKKPGRTRYRPGPLLVAVLGWSVVLVVLAGVGALVAVGANGPADPRLSTASVRDAALRTEFGEVAFQVVPVTSSGLATPERCALLADTDLERQKGLMGRSDLGGYDAMIFRFDADVSSTFFMRNVPMALSIAWFDASGLFVSSTDMEPCPDQEGCPQYPPAGPYRFAIEVPKGGLARLGITQGSTLSLGGGCAGPKA